MYHTPCNGNERARFKFIFPHSGHSDSLQCHLCPPQYLTCERQTREARQACRGFPYAKLTPLPYDVGLTRNCRSHHCSHSQQIKPKIEVFFSQRAPVLSIFWITWIHHWSLLLFFCSAKKTFASSCTFFKGTQSPTMFGFCSHNKLAPSWTAPCFLCCHRPEVQQGAETKSARYSLSVLAGFGYFFFSRNKQHIQLIQGTEGVSKVCANQLKFKLYCTNSMPISNKPFWCNVKE